MSDDYLIEPIQFGVGNEIGTITSNISSNAIGCAKYKELAVNIKVGTPSGTSPTLSISFLVYDPQLGYGGPPVAILTFNLTPTALSAAATLRLVISNGVATLWNGSTSTTLGNLSVPALWGLSFTVGGTSPSWPIDNLDYEARK